MNYIYLLVNLIIIPVLVVAGRGRDGVADRVAGDRVHDRGIDVRDRVRAGDRDVRDDGVRNAPVRRGASEVFGGDGQAREADQRRVQRHSDDQVLLLGEAVQSAGGRGRGW